MTETNRVEFKQELFFQTIRWIEITNGFK